MIKKRFTRKQKRALSEFDGEIRAGISRIRAISFSLEKKTMRRQIETICILAGDILDQVHQIPETLNSVQTVLAKYLNTLHELSKKYKKLASLPNKDNEIAGLMGKTEKAVSDIQLLMERIQKKLMSEELLDLDIQLSVLETEIEMDNLL